MKCVKCGEPNSSERLECARCGEPLLDALSDTGVSRVTDRSAPTVPPGDPTLKPQPTAPAQATIASQMTGSLYRSGPGGASAPSSPTLSGELPPSTVFANRYEIMALVGQGGMGRVYMALDRELDKVIALKTIRSEPGGEGTEAVQRFKLELLLARKITHKNVVRIHDLGEDQGIKFFTMEFIEGESLKALIRKRGKIPPVEAIPLARQILGALEEAHAQGVVHRDLKPQNIMVDKSGTPYLMDFGIARSVETTGITATGAVVGTPDYMSPEQVRGDKAGPPSDLFSFGIILYEMLTGDLPYRADTPASKIVMRLTHKPRAPRECAQDIPKYLEKLVLKCMEVDPALRYGSASEILADLDRGQVASSLTLRLERAVSRRKGMLTAVAAALLLAAGGAYWAAQSRATAPPPAGPVQTLAIVPFTNATGSAELEWMRTGLPEMLVGDLSQSSYVRPVPGERVQRVLQEVGLAQQSRFDEAALESVSRRAPAQAVLSGQFVESGGKLRLDLSLRRAGSGVAVPLKVEGTPAEVFGVVDKVTRQVKEQLDLSPEQLKRDADRPFAEVRTASLEALKSYQAGIDQLRRGENKAAVPHLKEATAKDASFAMAFAKLAEAYQSVGERQEAAAAIDRARGLSEKTALPLPERYQVHATAARIKGDNDAAVKSYAELAKLYPDDPDVLFQLGRSYEDAGRLPDAIAAYQGVVRIAPTYGAALLGLGRTQVMAGKPAEAIRFLQDALGAKQFQDDVEAQGLIHTILGAAYRETAQFDKALEHLNVALDLRRKAGLRRGEAATLHNLGDVYRRMGKLDKSLAAENKALAIARQIGDKKGESNYLVSIGQIHKRGGNLDRALAAFRESMQLEMERKDDVALANREDHIAEILRLKGQYDDAMVYLQQAKSHLEKSQEKREKAFNYEYIGLVRKAQGLYDQAVEAFLAALPLFQEIHYEEGIAMVQHDLARIYTGQGRYGDAEKALQQSLDIYVRLKAHDVADVRADRGRLLVALGRADEAENALKEAAEGGGHGHGDHDEGPAPEVLLGRAELAHLRGKLDLAAKAYEAANVGANLSGQKEVAVESRVALGRLFLEQGKLDRAERLLVRTQEEAKKARLRPLEAAALAVLAQTRLARGQAEAARKTALEATSVAEAFSGRPTLVAAQACLGDALQRLGRGAEATDAYAKAAATLDWIRGGLTPEQMAAFVARPDTQAFYRKTVAALEKGGRSAEAEPLRKWIGPAAGS